MTLRDPRWTALTVTLLLALGCSKGPKTPTVPVSGTIKYNGTPVAQATVAFINKTPAEGKNQHPARGVTDDQGRYTLSTYINPNEYPGVPPGDYTVTVSKREAVGEVNVEDMYNKQLANMPKEGTSQQQVGQVMSQQQQQLGPKSLIPEKYEDATQNLLPATVKPTGENKFDFDLTD